MTWEEISKELFEEKTGKRFTSDGISLLKDGEFWLDGSVSTICNAEEICELLNELHEEKEEIYKYISEQINIYYKELKSWEKTCLNNLDEKILKKNQARRDKQIFIKEIEIMCLYNLLQDLGKEDLVDWYE